jgi:hypothetical protein
MLFENSGWALAPNSAEMPGAGALAGAFPLPAGNRDAALLLTLAPGAYTAQVTDPTGRAGTVLVEAYAVP